MRSWHVQIYPQSWSASCSSLPSNKGFILTASKNCCSHFPMTALKIEKKSRSLICSGQEKFLESKFRILTAELTECACSGNQRILWQRFPGRFQRDVENPCSQTWNKVAKKRSQSGLMCPEGPSPKWQIFECRVWCQQAVEQGPAEVMWSW